MRQLLSILLVSLAFMTIPTSEAKAQNPYTFSVVAGDSLATADTVFKKITLDKGYGSLGIQVNIKKGTGTLDGKVYVLTSINALSYVLTDSASITAVPVNALTNNGAYTHTAVITKVSPPGTRYIVYVTQDGSLTASPTLFSYTARKHD